MTCVLIVDDKEESLYLLRALLGGNGFTVIEACNGAEALEKARLNPPDIVVSDLLMPVMDGYTLLRHWRADDALRKIPFIVYTATYTDPKDEQFALSLGAATFILKPAEPEQFMERIQHVLTHHKTLPLPADDPLPGDDNVILQQYSEVLVRKLEAKMAQLEQSNRTLQEEINVRKETEEQLRKLSAAVEQSPVGIIITDIAGNIEYVNPQMLQMTGYASEELTGQNPRMLKSGETPKEVYQELWNAITAGGQWRGEFHNKRKDGSLYWDRSAISPIRDASGAITHFLAVKENITAEKALEAQYLNAQKMEAIGRLAGGIAHDFNNMLGVIMGYTEAAMMDLKPMDPIYKDLEQVQLAATRSAALTRQLLAFSRRQTITPVVMDLNAQLNGMKGLLRRLIGEDIDIQFALFPDLCPVKMDPSQVDQIIANLAVNARDAMPDGGRLTIETANVHFDDAECQIRIGLSSGDYVVLAVSDTGCGMDVETVAHIYEPFFTTKSEGKGTGLGLATVYGTVSQNKGAIQVYSEPGQGTTFRIYLPKYVGAGEAPPTVDQGMGVPRGHETVLLVEDDGMLRTLTKRMLEWCGYHVLDAMGPGEAIALCEKHRDEIHLLLTDVVMPVMNGKELVDRVRGLRPGIKTLYMSGYTADAIAHRGVLEAGVNFIGKPFTLSDFGKKVRQVLDARG